MDRNSENWELGKIRHARLVRVGQLSRHQRDSHDSREPIRALDMRGRCRFSQPYTGYGDEAMRTRWWESGIIGLYEMPPPGARGNHWEIDGTEGHLSGDQLNLYNNGEHYQDVYTEIDGEQVLDHVRIE